MTHKCKKCGSTTSSLKSTTTPEGVVLTCIGKCVPTCNQTKILRKMAEQVDLDELVLSPSAKEALTLLSVATVKQSKRLK